MEITFYLQFQHPSCSPQEPDWDLPCLSWVTLQKRGQKDAGTLCHRQVCVPNTQSSEALGTRLSSLILSGQQRPVTVSSVLMVKHTFCPHHLPGSLHSHAGTRQSGTHRGWGRSTGSSKWQKKSGGISDLPGKSQIIILQHYFCCAARHMWECIKAMSAHIHASFTHRGSIGSRKETCSCAVPTWPQGNDSML